MILRFATLQTNNIICKRYASTVNHYAVLGLSPSASLQEIKRKYRELSKKYHPDLNTENKEENNELFIKITKSYEILSNVSKRREYDLDNVDNIKNHQDSKREEFRKKYYGSSSYRPSGLNSTRNRVYNASSTPQPNYRSIFNGEYRDYSINDVPHFDYEKHLRKNINVDKHYSENHSFKNNDYMVHFVRNGQSFAADKNKRHQPRNIRTYQNDVSDERSSNGPIWLTFLTALSLMVIISKG